MKFRKMQPFDHAYIATQEMVVHVHARVGRKDIQTWNHDSDRPGSPIDTYTKRKGYAYHDCITLVWGYCINSCTKSSDKFTPLPVAVCERLPASTSLSKAVIFTLQIEHTVKYLATSATASWNLEKLNVKKVKISWMLNRW